MGTKPTSLGPRFESLDVMRGLTIALMIVVNTPGSWSHIYGPFNHATWHGFTITDLVFPTFLFVVGNAMSFSLKKMDQMDASAFLKKVGKRALKIFIIGWLLNAYPFFTETSDGLSFINPFEGRLMGVLQRIALCYFIAALVLYYLKGKSAWFFMGLALFGYWALLYFFGESTDPYGLKTNAALYLDLASIGESRMYGGEGIPFDPEGLLSTLPAVVNVLAGYYVGKFLQQRGSSIEAVIKLIGMGSALIIAAYLWDLVFPINKKIWTSSYVLLTIGWDMLILAILVYSIELKKWFPSTYFFQVFGKNPLILYVASGVVISTVSMIPVGDTNLQSWIYSSLFTSWLSPKTASLAFALFYTAVIWLIGLYMDKKKIYIKV